MKINELKIEQNLIRNLNKQKFTELTPIQEKTIPISLSGKDVIGIAKTGSGKTLAYSIPLINKAYVENNNPKIIRSVIIVPTRELAMQVRNAINAICSDSIRVCVIMGGVSLTKQVHDMKKGTDIIVATPGRLNDLIKQRKIKLSNVDSVVLDEADTMLDMGFLNDIEHILSKMLNKRQTLMFTATMGKTIQDFVNKNLSDPTKIVIESKKEDQGILTEELYFMKPKNKKEFLLDYLAKNRVTEGLIFVKTKADADELCKYLNEFNLKSAAIHSDKRQGERTRNLANFKEGKVNFLIATDIASRGIDIKNMPLVINYSLPEQSEVYIHRVGRTARNSQDGLAVSICTPAEKHLLKDIEKLIKRKIPLKVDDKYSLEYLEDIEEKHSFKPNKKNFNNKKFVHKRKTSFK